MATKKVVKKKVVKKVPTKAKAAVVTASFQRFDGVPQKKTFRKGTTVSEALSELSISLSSSETINNDLGREVRSSDFLTDGDEYYIVQNHKAGCQ